ncbi:extracellular calcium-sensing receptor-like [Ambystoma mexicanum]|uniref:extracellular calcium-sensing receptor-like n=1 Tax=Ambystoma mexicanum TaxID=8296 RepID=UPI0037E8A338
MRGAKSTGSYVTEMRMSLQTTFDGRHGPVYVWQLATFGGADMCMCALAVPQSLCSYIQQKQTCFQELHASFNLRSYHWSRAVDFAVEEINQDQSFLPNITLGFRMYDSCLSLARSNKAITWLLAGGGAEFPNYGYQGKSPLASVIADSGSTESIAIARWLGLYRYPQISYFASSTLLSDKLQFPSFFRMIPSDDFQARGLAQLVFHFGWTWVGILSTENDYGQQGSQILKEELSKFEICIAFHETIPLIAQDSKINQIVEKVTTSTAKVILVFSSDPYIWPVMEKLYKLNATRKVWVASEGWSTAAIVSNIDIAKVMSGTIGFAIQKGEMPGFREFLLRIHPSSFPNDTFLKSFWEYAFRCQWSSGEPNATRQDQVVKNLCTSQEDLGTFSNTSISEPDFRIGYAVYNAVYAVAHALRNMQSCVPGCGPFINNTCADVLNFRPWEVRKHSNHFVLM